jgi:UDP-N-acetylglucosamine 2-epimerase (non-hydrolysing)
MSREVCFVVGARPNFMKAAPVYQALSELDGSLDLLLVHTGQHYDTEMSDVFLEELGLPVPHVFLATGSGTHAEQTARALLGIEKILVERRPVFVVVAGDVNSTLAGALAAVKLGIPVAHIESGLRSFDQTMPEEHNRRLTDHVSTVLLVHSQSGVDNLRREGIDNGVELVGNTMIDSLLRHVDAARGRRPWESLDLEPESYALVTLHRPALVDDDATLRAVADGLVALQQAMPVVFPAHPRTRNRLDTLDLVHTLETAGVRLVPPLGYLEFLGLEAAARVVVTDSGGVQEETSALGVPCFTLRDSTERPVTLELGTNVLLGARPERLAEVPSLLPASPPGQAIPLWDGAAGPRAAAALRRSLEALA